MGAIGKHGISATTPKNIHLGAGTIHRNLAWDASKKEWTGEIIGATAGGNKVSIKGEVTDIELDGAKVKVKGLAVKQGGTGTMEVNFAEIKTDILKMATLFKEGTTDAEGYTMLVDKPNIEETDYIEGFAFVGLNADTGKNIVIIFENALCTSGLDFEGKNKENTVIKLTMEAYANNEGDLDTLPIKIYNLDDVTV